MSDRTRSPELRDSEMELVLPYDHPLTRPLIDLLNEANKTKQLPIDGVGVTMLVTFGDVIFTFCWGLDHAEAELHPYRIRTVFKPVQISVADGMDYQIIHNQRFAESREKELRDADQEV